MARAAKAIDFFISYAGTDRPWAEWASQQLEDAGYSTELDAWDWAAGSNAVLKMNDALDRAERVLALLSKAYFERERFTTDEWTAIFAERPDKEGRHRLVPVRVEEVEPLPILKPVVYRDLFGLEEARAREELLAAASGPQRPQAPVPFPGKSASGGTASAGGRPPGSYPALWNAPRRNPAFTGRHSELAALRQRLAAGDRALVQALHGWGGVGKTQVAIEYAHLFANDYELVWWIDAEQSELIGEQLAALGEKAGWLDSPTAVGPAIDIVHQQLRARARWLLVFDNIASSEALVTWLPPETGHVIVTSRSGGFLGIATAVEIDVFTRPESIDFFREHLPTMNVGEAEQLADALGDLPLALAQAAGLIGETRMPVADYLRELQTRGHTIALLAENKPLGYPVALAAAIEMSLATLAERDPAASQLIQLCAHFAPEPILLTWFTSAPADALDGPLGSVTGTVLAFRRTLRRIADLGLARVDQQTVQVHRITQAVLRDRHQPGDLNDDSRRVEKMLSAAAPTDLGAEPATWPQWVALLPHLLSFDRTAAGSEFRSTLCRASHYLVRRGQYTAALALADSLHTEWRAAHGPDDTHTLAAAYVLAMTHLFLDHPSDARRISEDGLARSRRMYGEDHPDTLVFAAHLAAVLRALGDYQAARKIDEDTMARYRRVLGADHPNTLGAAIGLASDLDALGEYEAARKLDEVTLARYRQAHGDDYPDTLTCAHNLAADLRALGDHEAARELDEDTLARYRRVLGDDHPFTLGSAENLAADLNALREYKAAHDIHADTLGRLRRVLGDDHPDTLRAANNYAVNLQDLQQFRAAHDVSEDTLIRSRRVLGDDDPITLQRVRNHAVILRALGRDDAARELEADTRARSHRAVGDDQPDTPQRATSHPFEMQGLEEQAARNEHGGSEGSSHTP